MTEPYDAERLKGLIEAASSAWSDFCTKREAMNSAIPSLDASPAERALYDERYKADHEAEREHFRTALELAHSSAAIATALAAQAEEIERLRDEVDEAVNWSHIVDLNGTDQFDDLAEAWLRLPAIRRIHQAMASPFAKFASEDIMQRFLQIMRDQLQIAYVEGALAGVKAEVARRTALGGKQDD